MISRVRFSFSFDYFLMGVALVFLCGCNAGIHQEEQQAQADMIYMDYQVTGEEDRGEVTVRIQFRYGGPEGNALVLNTPASVSFDGQLMSADSSKMGGAYYEINYLTRDFGGLHQIEFKDGSGKTYTDTFHFPFFSLPAALPAAVSRTKGLEIEVKGVAEEHSLHVMLTDTSFYGRGVDRMDTVRDGKLFFSQAELGKLRNGPIHLEFYREEERGLQKTGRQGGRLYLSYSLSKEFLLID